MRRLWKQIRAGAFWAGPLALPGAAFDYLYLHYDELPERFPIRWSATGQAELWTEKNVQGVLFGPVAAWCVLIFTLLAEWLIHASLDVTPGAGEPSEPQEGAARRLWIFGWMNWIVAALFSALAVAPGRIGDNLQRPVWWLAVAVYGFVVATLFRTLRIRSH
jgi:uncharacterized membrane protein